MSSFADLFGSGKPLIGVIHLPALPGAPLYDGNTSAVFEKALNDLAVYLECGFDGVIVENFADLPFEPEKLGPETVASLAAVTREVVINSSVPVGVNALRSDGEAAVAVANAAQADFVRVNVHVGVVVSEQGLVVGRAHDTMRLRAALRSDVLVFADVGVKHATPLVAHSVGAEARDAVERALADAVIVSGELTGAETDPSLLDEAANAVDAPVLIGSGLTPDNAKSYGRASGFIVGSYCKVDGLARNAIDPARARKLHSSVAELA